MMGEWQWQPAVIIPGRDGLFRKRQAVIVPGWDCIAHPCGQYGCGKDPGSSHGRHNDEWMFAVTNETEDVVLTLTINSGVTPCCAPEPPDASDLSCHIAWPTSREQIKINAPPQHCSFVRGGCYVYFTTCLGARKFGEKYFVPELKTEQPEAFWAALEARAIELEKSARSERADTKWARCPHCDATGTVARKAT